MKGPTHFKHIGAYHVKYVLFFDSQWPAIFYITVHNALKKMSTVAYRPDGAVVSTASATIR